MEQRSSFDNLTNVCLVVGIFVGVVGGITYDGFLMPLAQSYLVIFGLERYPGLIQPFGTVFAMVVVSWFGLGLLFASFWIEGGDKEKKTTILVYTFWLTVHGLILTGIASAFLGQIERYESGLPSFLMIVLGLASLLGVIPILACWIVIFPVSLGLAVAGLLCLPRLLVYHTFRHPLEKAWSRAEASGQISPKDIADALGHPAKNTMQARKLKAGLIHLEESIKRKREELAREREMLRSAILGDAERFETEKRISKLLIDFDTLNTEVEAYRKYEQQKGKGR